LGLCHTSVRPGGCPRRDRVVLSVAIDSVFLLSEKSYRLQAASQGRSRPNFVSELSTSCPSRPSPTVQLDASRRRRHRCSKRAGLPSRLADLSVAVDLGTGGPGVVVDHSMDKCGSATGCPDALRWGVVDRAWCCCPAVSGRSLNPGLVPVTGWSSLNPGLVPVGYGSSIRCGSSGWC
jgi:hypothetical protein